MERSVEESKEGFYDVYYTDAGKKLIVLDDLYVGSVYEPPFLQQKISVHYDTVALLYWVLFGAALIYLVTVCISRPFLTTFKIMKR